MPETNDTKKLQDELTYALILVLEDAKYDPLFERLERELEERKPGLSGQTDAQRRAAKFIADNRK